MKYKEKHHAELQKLGDAPFILLTAWNMKLMTGAPAAILYNEVP